jgi:hypothetical protein
MENVMSDRVKTLEQKVEVLEDLVEHYQIKIEHTEERVRYLIAMLENRNDSGVQVFGA